MMNLEEMNVKAEIVGSAPFGEGPVWCDDGTLIVCNAAGGELYRVWPDERREVLFADTAGGANGAAPTSDGGFVVCQSGGFDLSSFGIPNAPPWRPVTPGLQLVSKTGSVRTIASGSFQAPNDLVVASDGTLYFTDPPRLKARTVNGTPEIVFPDERIGRVWKLDTAGKLTLFADKLFFPNGIGIDRDGQIVIVEMKGLMRLLPDGGREWVIEELGPGGGDGFCLDTDGNFYVAGTTDHCVRVVDPKGRIIDVLETDRGGGQHATNCCFGGPDNRTLYCVEMPGRVTRWRDMPKPGRPVIPWTPVTIRN